MPHHYHHVDCTSIRVISTTNPLLSVVPPLQRMGSLASWQLNHRLRLHHLIYQYHCYHHHCHDTTAIETALTIISTYTTTFITTYVNTTIDITTTTTTKITTTITMAAAAINTTITILPS